MFFDMNALEKLRTLQLFFLIINLHKMKLLGTLLVSPEKKLTVVFTMTTVHHAYVIERYTQIDVATS